MCFEAVNSLTELGRLYRWILSECRMGFVGSPFDFPLNEMMRRAAALSHVSMVTFHLVFEELHPIL